MLSVREEAIPSDLLEFDRDQRGLREHVAVGSLLPQYPDRILDGRCLRQLYGEFLGSEDFGVSRERAHADREGGRGRGDVAQMHTRHESTEKGARAAMAQRRIGLP